MTDAIVLAFDDGFAHYAVACLNSIDSNYPQHPAILVAYDGCRADVMAAIDRVGGRVLPAPGAVRGTFREAPAGEVANRVVYDRFMIWADGLAAYGNVLYLDADTLVLKPLEDLFQLDEFFGVANHEATAFVRVFDPALSSNPKLRRRLDEDGIAYPSHMDDMINAGVMLIPPEWRSAEQYERILYLYRRYLRYLNYADQSLISLWCAMNGIRPSAAFEYNFQSPMFTDPAVEIAFEDIKVLHFSGVRKPPTPEFRSWDRAGEAAPRCEQLFTHYLNLHA